MTKWLLSIVGVIFMGVLLDLLYPNGKTNAFCKSIFGIFAVFMIIQPILNLEINLDFDTEVVDSALVYNINTAKEEALKIKIENLLLDEGIEGVDVEIKSNLYNNIFEVENIYLDITNLVLTENITNINKYEVITNEITSAIEIDKERIIIYG